MKKLFKKSIACLIAVLMVVSTMPFTAVTASAATLTENDIANATTNRVVIKDAIYTYASSSAYYNYGTTISTESDWNTPITSTSTITKVECLDDASVLSVTDGKLSGSFASNTFKVSGATNVFATLKFTFSDGKVEYHKVAVKSYPVENHIACEAIKVPWAGSRTESGYTMFMRGSTGSGGSDGVWAYQKSYATSGTGTHAIDGSGIITSDKKAYAHGYSEGGDAVPNVITKATYYVDKSCRNTNWSALGNSELWNGTNYVIPIEVVRTRFFWGSGTANWNFDLNNMPVQDKLARTDTAGRNDANGTTYGVAFTHNASITESNRYTSCNDTACNIRIGVRTTDKGYALLKTNLIVNLFDKSVARNLYTTCLNSAVDSSEYTASSFLAYQNALLEMEAYLSNYEDATDATTSQAVYTNLNNAKNSLQSLYCTVTFSDALFNIITTVKVREGATVPADQFPTLPSPRQSSNKTQHTRYYFKNTADGTEFTTTTVVTSNVSVIETTKVEDCSGGTATCTSLAVCEVCNSTYGSLAAHSLTETVAKNATCTEAGNSAYWTCSTCNKMFSDANAATEITEVPTIPATGVHNYTVLVTEKQEPTCTAAGKEAVYKCATCDLTTGGKEIPATGVHNYTSVVTAPTCTEQGYTTYTCGKCGDSYVTDYKDALGHDMQVVEGSYVSPTCTVDGKEADMACSRCDYAEEGAVKPHIGHSYGSFASNGDGTHTKTCRRNCGEEGAVKTYDCYGGTATCTEAAICDACGSPYGNLLDHSYTMVKTPATCTEASTETYTCSSCGDSYSTHVDPATGHDWGDWTSISDTQHQRVCANDNSHVETKDHNIVNNACTDCGYVSLDMVAYDKAVAEYNALKNDSEYATKYTSTSITEYESLVDAEIAKESTFATQEEVDAAVAAILSAKTKLVYAQADVKVYIAREGVDPVLVDTISKNYGETADINIADKLSAGEYIAKWVIETQENKVNTKLATTDTTVSMVVTEPADVYVHIASEVATVTEQYSKVSFISKNGAVSFVKYVKAGETLNTDTVDGVEIPFYKFIGWSKASVTGTGEDIEVKAIYEFIEAVENKCTVHYNGTSKQYAYDKFVYIDGAENLKLALASDAAGTNIITYLNENAFYAPHIEDIYVIEVDTQEASIGITGTYFLPASETNDSKTFAFNCKMFLPEGCTLVETGLIAKSEKGTIKSKVEKVSSRGEFTAKLKVGANSTVTSVTGKAYLTYKNESNQLVTIYSEEVVLAQ